MTTEEEGSRCREKRCYAAGFEGEGRGRKPRNADNYQNWKRQGRDSPLEPPEGISPTRILMLAL